MDKSPTSIVRFLQDQLHYPASEELQRLDQLAGQRIAETDFLPDLGAARAAIEPWMPLFYLPVASASFGIGLHLRPSDVRSHRLGFCMAEAPGFFVERALSVEQLVYRSLLAGEGDANSISEPQSFAPAAAKANELFGADFYQHGRHGKVDVGDEYRLMVETFGGTPDALYVLATEADDPETALSFWERGIALGTESLVLYAGAARVQLELGRRREAAENVARSLMCYHHTAYDVDLDEYIEFGRPLLDEFPDVFGEDEAWQLRTNDPRLWAKRSHELFAAGQVERADKLLNDLCHGTGDYTAVLGAFRKHYQALGWDWALALCDLRS